jgi:hypothetical protein
VLISFPQQKWTAISAMSAPPLLLIKIQSDVVKIMGGCFLEISAMLFAMPVT